jgi:serine/threonine protein kinase
MIQTQRCGVHRFTTKCMGMKRMHDRGTFGHYRVLQRDDGSLWELGSGAMGVTYKALDTDLQCPVALKVINLDLMADEANRDRFLREARAAAGLRHSNVASVYHLAMDEERFFYAMEFIDGETTEANVARFGPMALRPALRIAWQVSKALAAAAKQQLVHRDIKPANIMIVADPEEEDWPFVKLIDFGLVWSAMRGADCAGVTRSGFLGTAQFASPEQIEESEVDGRSDIYSLGCTLWYLLTGEAPFTGPLASVFAQHLGSEPPWGKLTSFPKRIRRLLRRMLRKDPSQRPASAVELRREIERCLDNVERRDAFAARIALPLKIGRQWLNATPWPRRAVICGVCVIGAMIAFSYNGNKGISPQSAPAVQASGAMQVQDSPSPNGWFAKENPGWSYLATWDEPYRSLALARRVSLNETEVRQPGVIGVGSWLPGGSIADAEVIKPIAAGGDSWSGEERRFTTALALDDAEDKKDVIRKASTQDRHEVKRTTKRTAKKPQRRITSRDTDRGFNPLQELRRARENVKRVIRRIL